jgi:hypothetical protein
MPASDAAEPAAWTSTTCAPGANSLGNSSAARGEDHRRREQERVACGVVVPQVAAAGRRRSPQPEREMPGKQRERLGEARPARPSRGGRLVEDGGSAMRSGALTCWRRRSHSPSSMTTSRWRTGRARPGSATAKSFLTRSTRAARRGRRRGSFRRPAASRCARSASSLMRPRTTLTDEQRARACAIQSRAVEGDERERGPEVQHDDEREKRVGSFVDVPAQQRGDEHGVAEAADREQFADALQHREQHRLHERHEGVGSHAGEAFPPWRRRPRGSE